MLKRIDDFFAFLAVDKEETQRGKKAAVVAGEIADGMTHIKDYEALAAIALHFKPDRIFEIGTYLGVTSDFFLSLLPESSVVSIAYQNPRWKLLGKVYNNSKLDTNQIGSAIDGLRRNRFTQIVGDSHKLESQSFLQEHGKFDLVFIDGDHTRSGASQDTDFALKIIQPSGMICWHDANPRPKYMDVRQFLENDLDRTAIATADTYIGGIACWSDDIEKRLTMSSANS